MGKQQANRPQRQRDRAQVPPSQRSIPKTHPQLRKGGATTHRMELASEVPQIVAFVGEEAGICYKTAKSSDL